MSGSVDFKARNLVQRGTRSAQPAATAVAEGTLYYVTDEGLLERSTGSAWQSMGRPNYSAKAYNSADLTISNATWTLITWDSELFDTAAIHSTSSNTGRLTAPVTGKYLVVFQAGFGVSGTGDRFISIEKNGAGTQSVTRSVGVMQPGAPSATFEGYFTLSSIVSLTASDHLECFVYQSSGGNLLFRGNGVWTTGGAYFALIYLGE